MADRTEQKTPAQRLARVFRMLSAVAEQGHSCHATTEAIYCARAAIYNMRLKIPFKQCIRDAERLLKKALRAAGIDPESIQ